MKNFFQGTKLQSVGDWFWIALVFVFFIFFASSVVINEARTASAPPSIITYQGKLLEGGSAVTTTKTFSFYIYDASSGGSLLYTAGGTLLAPSTINLTPSLGIFSVDLGGQGTNELTTSTFANSSQLYLEVWVGGTKLTPRKQLTSAPYAINSQYLMGISATSTSSSLYIPHSDSNGNFAFTGTPQSSAVGGGVIYVNPGSADIDETLLGLAVGGTQKFRVDAEGDMWVTGTTTISGNLNVDGGTLFVDYLNNFVGVNSSTPFFPLSVGGQSYFSATSTVQDLKVLDGIVLGGVKRSSWPIGGGDISGLDNTFTGLNTFGATTTFSSTTVNGLLNVGNGLFYVDPVTGKVGVNSSTPRFNFGVEGESYFHGTTTFQGPLISSGKILNPTSKGSVDTGGDSAYDVVVEGDYAYVANGTDGLVIVDVSNPSSPTVLSTLASSSGASGIAIAVAGNYAYLVNSTVLDIIDISNPKHPVRLSTFSYGAVQLYDVTISGNYAYLAKGPDGVGVLDISEPKIPLSRSNLDPGVFLVSSLSLSGHYLYASISGGGGPIYIFDVSNPGSLVIAGSITLAENVNNISVSGKHLYVSTDANGLFIYDVSDVRLPSLVSNLAYGVQGTKILAAGDYAYFQLADSLRIIDISNKSTPHEVASFNNAGVLTSGFDVVGNYFFGANDVGLEVVDITGIKSANAGIGIAEIEKIQVRGNAEFGQNVRVKGGVNLGGGLQINGDLGIGLPTSTDSGRNRLRFSDGADFYTYASSSVSNLFVFDSKNTFSQSSSSTTYLLSVRNAGTPVFSVASNGDVGVANNLFASTTVIGTPGSPGDLAEHVDIAGDEVVEPGDVMIVDSEQTDTYRKSQHAYESAVAGVISTHPTLTIGFGKTSNTAVLAMVGRVPIKVSTENGPIQRGDILVTASSTGYAMRYDSTKDDDTKIVGIIGVALESLPEGQGKIMGLIRTGFVNNRHKTIADIQQELTDLAETQGANGAGSDLSVGENNGQLVLLNNDLDANAYSILNVKRIAGIDGKWEVDAEGRFVTRVDTSEGKKSLYSLQSGETEYVFSGSSHLVAGVARIDFDAVTKEIIDPEKPIKVNITLTSEALGVFISGKEATGFVVKELQGGSSAATFDWVVIASRKSADQVPPNNEEQVQLQENPPPQDQNPPADENPPAQDDNANQPQNDAPAGDGQEAPPQDAPADNPPASGEEQSAPPAENPPADSPPAEG